MSTGNVSLSTTNNARNDRESAIRFGRTAHLGLIAFSCALAHCSSDALPQGIGAVATAGSAGMAAAAGGGGSAQPAATEIDRSSLTDVGTGPTLDYADPRLWLCRPGNHPDECDTDLDGTELLADGTRKPVPHLKDPNPAVDCFYVYPTVKLTSAGPMTDFAHYQIALDPLLSQGAPFNQLCRMYAPLYRQAGVVPGAGGAPMASGVMFNLGLDDVRAAFKYYVEHLSQGRKFILVGHSQGAGMLTAMLAMDIDPDPALRARLVSAFLIGGGVTVPAGQAVGGSFKNVPLCTNPGQVGCVVAYNSFSKEYPASATSTFGRAADASQNVACTEPAALAGRLGMHYHGSFLPLKSENPTFTQDGRDQLPSDLSTRFVVYRDVFRGECKTGAGESYLEIALDMAPDDPRPKPPYHNAAIEPALGLHLVDYNLELDDLLETARLQAVAATK
jgi:pimeloyl-ACP methyl ester carboxylesterase